MAIQLSSFATWLSAMEYGPVPLPATNFRRRALAMKLIRQYNPTLGMPRRKGSPRYTLTVAGNIYLLRAREGRELREPA